ncbi:MAG TPA: GTP 3',8-cyclase MoaA [Rhodospirillaceae bacterium]|nr:GTP 3',8-cyclase MoaA [Rhodospirillaceae bacterium]
MIDPFGRSITYVRLSLTDRCDLRCVYCMAEEMEFLPREEVLSLEELERLSIAFIRLGVRKLRLTGGEPLVRRGVMSLIGRLGEQVQAGRLEELTLTTNGTRLAEFAEGLQAAGVKRINVSLDSLDPLKFRGITRFGRLPKVLEGIAAAKAAGLAVKINMVLLKDENDGEIDRMVGWCGREGYDLTLIETMPLGEVAGDRLKSYSPLDIVRTRLAQYWTLEPLSINSGGPARYVRIAETGQKLGFITPLTHGFCESCNRVRVTCTGTMFMCLGQEDATDLRLHLRDKESDQALEAAISEAISRKPRGHDFVIDQSRQAPRIARHMSLTGG